MAAGVSQYWLVDKWTGIKYLTYISYNFKPNHDLFPNLRKTICVWNNVCLLKYSTGSFKQSVYREMYIPFRNAVYLMHPLFAKTCVVFHSSLLHCCSCKCDNTYTCCWFSFWVIVWFQQHTSGMKEKLLSTASKFLLAYPEICVRGSFIGVISVDTKSKVKRATFV